MASGPTGTELRDRSQVNESRKRFLMSMISSDAFSLTMQHPQKVWRAIVGQEAECRAVRTGPVRFRTCKVCLVLNRPRDPGMLLRMPKERVVQKAESIIIPPEVTEHHQLLDQVGYQHTGRRTTRHLALEVPPGRKEWSRKCRRRTSG